MKKEPTTLKTVNYGLQPGEKLRLKIMRRFHNGWREHERNYTVVAENDNFITLDNGTYKETYNKKEIALGFIKIERKNCEMVSPLKFTKEELIVLCRKHGTGGRIILERIAAELGDKATNVKQIQNAIQNWKIKELLAKDPKNNKEGKKVESADQNIQTETEPESTAEQSAANTANAEDKPTETIEENPTASAKEIEGFRDASKKLAGRLNITSEDIEQAIHEVRSLDELGEKVEGMFDISPKNPSKPTGRLKVAALVGEKFIYNLNHHEKTLEISMPCSASIEVHFEDISTLVMELSNLNHNYIKRKA